MLFYEKLCSGNDYSANSGPGAEMAIGVTEYGRYFWSFISKIGFVEGKLWFAVKFMKCTEIRNSTGILEFHGFHEFQHKKDEFLLDFIRVSRYG